MTVSYPYDEAKMLLASLGIGTTRISRARKVCHIGCSNTPSCKGTSSSVSPRLGTRMANRLTPPKWEV